jgi:hypothetical protein
MFAPKALRCGCRYSDTAHLQETQTPRSNGLQAAERPSAARNISL